jgi:hypothetical protein
VENTNGGRRGECESEGESVCRIGSANQAAERETEPALGGLPDGLPAAVVRAWPEVHNRVSQLKGYGNAIVPQVAEIILRAIKQLHNP